MDQAFRPLARGECLAGCSGEIKLVAVAVAAVVVVSRILL